MAWVKGILLEIVAGVTAVFVMVIVIVIVILVSRSSRVMIIAIPSGIDQAIIDQCNAAQEYPGQLNPRGHRDDCFMAAATAQNDIRYCDYIQMVTSKTFIPTRYQCYREVGVSKGDVEICKYLPQDASEYSLCLSTIAQNQRNASLCAHVYDSLERRSCYIFVATALSDDRVCAMDTDVDIQDNCYSELAIAAIRPELCEKIQQEAMRDNCRIQVGVLQCDAIENKADQDACYARYQPGKTFDVTMCSGMTGQDNIDGCFAAVAEAKRDTQLCGLIVRQDRKDGCVVTVAETRRDLQLCETIVTQENRDDCFFRLARVLKEVGLCQRVSEKAAVYASGRLQKMREYCVADVTSNK